jgi:hypothetical protein
MAKLKNRINIFSELLKKCGEKEKIWDYYMGLLLQGSSTWSLRSYRVCGAPSEMARRNGVWWFIATYTSFQGNITMFIYI